MTTAEPALPAAFFIPQSAGRFQATQATQGPWAPADMHGGPLAGLIATLLTDQAQSSRPSLRLARLSVDFFGGLPIGELDIAVAVLRPGKRIALIEANVSAGGRTVAVGRGWFIDASAAGGEPPLIYGSDPNVAGEIPPLAEPPAMPDSQPQRFFAESGSFGYGAATEWRFTSGGFDHPGPAGVWCRPRIPLIAGRALTGLQRMLILGDAANGMSGDLPWAEWLFIPPGITVTILREPVSEWVHLAARTTLGSDGIGLCHGVLADGEGPVAVVSQPLLITRR
jgi:hypothetical protein